MLACFRLCISLSDITIMSPFTAEPGLFFADEQCISPWPAVGDAYSLLHLFVLVAYCAQP